MFVHIYNKGYKEHMSTHTSKVDPNIIELAKQRYESTQRGKLPSIIVSLASAGKIYPASSPLRAATFILGPSAPPPAPRPTS